VKLPLPFSISTPCAGPVTTIAVIAALSMSLSLPSTPGATIVSGMSSAVV
jgi:hypothetical protein